MTLQTSHIAVTPPGIAVCDRPGGCVAIRAPEFQAWLATKAPAAMAADGTGETRLVFVLDPIFDPDAVA
ncbi:hypothetical protein [Pseudoruegeria sp. SK021]|uniref:hypothetical protein n=1 Tax=Pseudoruegeria sp. SK021 TaxID=1933035 RepID=UPI000A22141E|nr:hypothetical protein [Pseudoruegeria sp. SK021]OSP53482.1 hypothetical protein BV911_17760 [Pseudoruegeria sp. SK021]